MDEIKQILEKEHFKGELEDSADVLDFYSHDASMFELRPKLVVCPHDAADVEILVSLVTRLKKSMPDVSLTARSAGTDMSGGAINDSIIVDFNKHFTKIEHVSA